MWRMPYAGSVADCIPAQSSNLPARTQAGARPLCTVQSSWRPRIQAVRDTLHRELAQHRGGGVMSESIVLREATVADIPTLVTLVHTAFEDYREQLDPPSGAHSETPETFRQALQMGYAALALANDAAVGCVFYHQEGEHLYLGRLSVVRPFRRHGVGQALTAYVEQRARALGLARVQLGVRTALPHLQAYYERLGYGVVRYEVHQGYTTPTSVVMEKQVRDE